MTPQSPPEQRIWFNGRDHYAEIAHTADLDFGDGDFTLMAKFKAAESVGERRCLISKGQSYASRYSLYLDENGRLTFEVGLKEDGAVSVTAVKVGRAITAGQLHAAYARRSSSGLHLLLDGDETAECAGVSGSASNERNLQIGRGEDEWHFQGEITTIRIFGRALTDEKISDDISDGATLDLRDDAMLEAEAEGGYSWPDASGGENNAVLRTEVIRRYALTTQVALKEDPAPGLVERLPPELRKADLLRELFEAVDEYWRENIDDLLPLLEPQSLFDASDEDVNLRLEELTTYFDEYSRQKSRPLSVVWKKEEIRSKNSVAAFESLLKRFQISKEYITYTPLYCRKDYPYGSSFFAREEIKDDEIDEYFLSSHVDMRVDHDKILDSDFDKNDIRRNLERYFEDNIRPTHIVFQGLNFSQNARCRTVVSVAVQPSSATVVRMSEQPWLPKQAQVLCRFNVSMGVQASSAVVVRMGDEDGFACGCSSHS